jgi:hypothetical protein
MTDPADNSRQFKELREDIRAGFESINSRIDNLVTRNEFKSEIRRIDEKHDNHVNSTVAAFKERDEDLEKVIVGNRWALGISLTAVAIIVTVVTAIIDAITI